MKMKIIQWVLIISICLSGCKKNTLNPIPLSSVEIVNTVANSPGAQLNSNTNIVVYNSYGQFGLPAGANTSIYVFPVGDSTNPYYYTTLSLVNGGIYSLYLSGNNQNTALLFRDTIPSYSDSVMGIRFINLSSDSGPVNVNVMGAANGSTVPSLNFQAITSFQTFSVNAANSGGYTFEIRNVADSVLSTYSQVPFPFKNITIVFSGLVGDGTFSAFTVNNY
jgi:hypothetical protein